MQTAVESQMSNMHVHLCEADLSYLLDGYLEGFIKKAPLGILGEWVSNIRVDVYRRTKFFSIKLKENVIVLGSDVFRPTSQIETDYGDATYILNDRTIPTADTLPENAPKYILRYGKREILVPIFIPTDHIHISVDLKDRVALHDCKVAVYYPNGKSEFLFAKFNEIDRPKNIGGLIHKNKASYFTTENEGIVINTFRREYDTSNCGLGSYRSSSNFYRNIYKNNF